MKVFNLKFTYVILTTSLLLLSLVSSNERNKKITETKDNQNDTKLSNKKGNMMRSFSSSFSMSSSMGSNGKPKRHVRSMSTEEYVDQDGNKAPQIRKYGELYKKDNDKPATIKKKANSNVEEENLILNGDQKDDISILDKNQEKDFFGENMFDNFFGGNKGKSGKGKLGNGMFDFGGFGFPKFPKMIMGDDDDNTQNSENIENDSNENEPKEKKLTMKMKTLTENNEKIGKHLDKISKGDYSDGELNLDDKDEANRKGEEVMPNSGKDKHGRYGKYLKDKTEKMMKKVLAKK